MFTKSEVPGLCEDSHDVVVLASAGVPMMVAVCYGRAGPVVIGGMMLVLAHDCTVITIVFRDKAMAMSIDECPAFVIDVSSNEGSACCYSSAGEVVKVLPVLSPPDGASYDESVCKVEVGANVVILPGAASSGAGLDGYPVLSPLGNLTSD